MDERERDALHVVGKCYICHLSTWFVIIAVKVADGNQGVVRLVNCHLQFTSYMVS